MTQSFERPRLLIVDDDRDLREDLKQYLTIEGYDVTEAENASAARRALHAEEPDLILLDIMMPGEDGISLCRSLARSKPIPTIFVSARSDDIDRIVGLEVGADDYVSKPYNPRELLARIKSVLRRATGGSLLKGEEVTNLFEFDRWVLDLARRRLTRDDGVLISLSATEFQLLKVFLSRPNIVLSRDRILELTRIEGEEVFDRSVDSQISRFRRKLEIDPKDPQLIQTVWGGGYMFAAEVRRL
ncbi:MAG: response regulator [Henriciella sp.]|nr:response regulator [Henriciella sp.]